MHQVYISRIHFPVTTLGPGKRIGIWFQGCSIGCKGCVSVDTWRHGIGSTTISMVTEQIRQWANFADGITITGGEPFDQPSALKQLVRWLKREFKGDVLVYTGYSKHEVQATLEDVYGCIDALISEPFEYQESDALPIRGSDNQKLHYLTRRGGRLFSQYEDPRDEPALDAMFDENGVVWFCGIPKRQDLERLEATLRSNGHDVVFTSQNIRMDK